MSGPQAGQSASVGTGRVYDSSAFSDNAEATPPPEGSICLNMPMGISSSMPSRSHYFLSRSEIMKGAANRFVHSTAYLYLYAGMALASFATVMLSLAQDCPGPLFYSLELVINIVLIAEVSMRCFAFGNQFWKSTFNIVDLCLVLLCAITLVIIFFNHDCSHRRPPFRGGADDDGEHRSGRGEELLDSLLLIVRNVAQCVRLLSVVRRSGSNVTSRVPAIDLNAARGYSIDFDLEDEGNRARERMAFGGDRAAQERVVISGKPGRPTEDERAALFDMDDDEL
ncbi:hypothetical protein K437DRAFT_246873 [Tilletiaria anomala UBC 951]|uniref:Ion transport domain-containing protein n=1 Tax=Tilletiaria anomala (strain ATCC 24038 / CBS 436.72 / UBC 951) TaxID=1037660 RepID=A0A066W4B3_TILAU|nr:uncharacterized protein K437DRAFT_246873 [Tilletiaria anomala UBC 951]KDN45899.1 hypothetical protein K437DRAFT_246873 [Tilletiaria anomala UBC 951]